MIEVIEEQFLLLKSTAHPSYEFSSNKSLEQCWDLLVSSFCQLCDFFGDLSTIFPTTATVESDFSLINYEMDDNCRNLSII